MSVLADLRDDLRTIDELVNSPLIEVSEALSWQAVTVLHGRGTAEVLQYAKRLSTSPRDRERRFGADILGQLGVPNRNFPVECAAILCGMLDAEHVTCGINLRSDCLVVSKLCRCHPAGHQVFKSFRSECSTCRSTCAHYRRVSHCDDVPRSHEPRYH